MGKRPQNRLRKKAAKRRPVRKAPVKRKPVKGVPIIRTTGRPGAPVVYRKPETISIWQRLESIRVSGKDECIDAFLRIMREMSNGSYAFEEGERDMGKYFVVHEPNRQGSVFVHVVPREMYRAFHDMRRQMPDSFLGFSVLCGSVGSKPARVSCFGIPTSEITKAMVSKRR